jgi:hypothetical protein
MWTIAIILSSTIQSVGQFATQNECERALKQFQLPGVIAGCVNQPTAEQSMSQALQMLNSFMASQPR